MQRQKLIIGADHAGFALKEKIKKHLSKKKIDFVDAGTYSEGPVDYPDIAKKVALAVRKDKNSKGILICGTGEGMAVAANKIKGILADLVYDSYVARMSREHGNANIICLRGRKFSHKKSIRLLDIWLSTKFSGAKRHARRLNKIKKLERENL